jgi:DNA polymerase V
VPMVRPAADTGAIVRAAVLGLHAIYRDGFKYAKAGVMLLELQPDSVLQGELDWGDTDKGSDTASLAQADDKIRLMGALDSINQRFGKGTMKMASAGLEGDRRVWSMKQERRTPAYTTCWADIPVARA